MNFDSACCTIILTLYLFTITINGQNEDSRVIAELQLADLELQDDCENSATVLKAAIIKNDFKSRIDAHKKHGRLLNSEAINLNTYGDIPFEIQRNWTTLVKSGDTLLSNEDWDSLVSYYIGNEELTHTVRAHCNKEQQKCPLIKNGYETILESARNESILKKSWSAWQSLLTLRRDSFPNILNLVNKAATQNQENDAKSYWQMLVDYADAYDKADVIWTEIQPFYLKLQNFVKTRIFKFYGLQNDSSFIPVYLLGSNFGYDWSYVADIVLPHPFIHHNAKTRLKKMPVESVYKLAEKLTEELSLGKLGGSFWSNSLFNMTFCDNHVISFCTQDHSELLTCNKVSWVSYLDAFEVAADVSLRNIDYLTLPRLYLRCPVIDEVIKSMSSVLAIRNMRHNGILNKQLFESDDEYDPNKMTELLLTALRILPKLSYYLLADKWRLHLLENGFDNIDTSWWKFRQDFQGVEGILNNEPDFLGDPYIISNKPYLGKFLGIILMFQFLEHYKLEMFDTNDNIALNIGKDENFLTMIHERSSSEWENLIYTYFGISDLSASFLLDYFKPLETYLDSAPLEQEEIPTTEIPTTTTTTKSSVKLKKVGLKSEKINSTDTTRTNGTISTNKNAHPKHIHEYIEENPNPEMNKASMYLGLGLLGAVGAILLFVIGSKVLKRRKRNNNRRFET